MLVFKTVSRHLRYLAFQYRQVSLLKRRKADLRFHTDTVTLVGLVGNTPDVRTIQSGTSITAISLATIRNLRTATATACPRPDGNRISQRGPDRSLSVTKICPVGHQRLALFQQIGAAIAVEIQLCCLVRMREVACFYFQLSPWNNRKSHGCIDWSIIDQKGLYY